jgi:hypothetical protein
VVINYAKSNISFADFNDPLQIISPTSNTLTSDRVRFWSMKLVLKHLPPIDLVIDLVISAFLKEVYSCPGNGMSPLK